MRTRLKNYISTLSDEERALYKPLIDDAARRDAELALAAEEMKMQAEMYVLQAERLREATARFNSGVSRLNRKLLALSEFSERAFPHLPYAGNEGVSRLKH